MAPSHRTVGLAAVAALSVIAFAEARVDDAVHRPADEGGPRRLTVSASDGAPLHRSASPAASIIAELSVGAVLANLGCARKGGRVWCEVRPFRGGPRGFVDADALAPARAPDGSVPTGPDDSRTRAGRRAFDAEGEIACAMDRGQPMAECNAAVARGGGGDATVVVTFSNGFARELYFMNGEFVAASATMSGVGRDADWRTERGTHLVRVDDQRYELPHDLLFGD